MFGTVGHRTRWGVCSGVAVAATLLTGCTVTAPQPAAPTINVDQNKSVDQQLEEVKTGFAKLYCPIRESKAADVIVDYAKGLWNDIAAKNPSAGIPPFNPNDPAMCK